MVVSCAPKVPASLAVVSCLVRAVAEPPLLSVVSCFAGSGNSRGCGVDSYGFGVLFEASGA